MKDLHISLPQPCAERWENMSPRGPNRLCAACDETIHDLAALTLEEAEALLESDRKVCVRARIRPSGTVVLADRGRTNRRMKALVGASLGLAVAACQTTGVTPLYTVSGLADGGMRVQLKGLDGTFKEVRTDRGGRFRIANLRAGTYELTTWGSCGGEQLTVPPIQITDDDVDIGTIATSDEGCIIVGMMERSDADRIG
jgi:hypothetical protein